MQAEATVRGTGIGPALRQARLARGKSIEEASRETRIRPEYLQALERERFEALIGDVYVRGFLRSYSTYLGLDPAQVLPVSHRHFGPPRPLVPEAPPGPVRSHLSVHPHLPNLRRHPPSWAFLIAVALAAMAVLGAAGLFSRSRSSPESVDPGAQASIGAPPKVLVVLAAHRDVRAKIRVDGKTVLDGRLHAGQGLSYSGTRRIDVWLGRGRVVEITVNGHSLGKPGKRTASYAESFGPHDYRRTSSATNSPGP